MDCLTDEQINSRPTDKIIEVIMRTVNTCAIHALSRADKNDDEESIISAVIEELQDWQNC